MATPIRTINRSLSIYQLIGFISLFILMTIYFQEYNSIVIPIAGFLFLPFVVVSCTTFLNREKDEKQMKIILYVGLFLMVFPVLPFPLFFDFAAWLSIPCILFIIFLTLAFYKDLDLQLLVVNSVGTILVTLIIIISVFIFC